jgi:ABC-2 type transport system permease protein
MLGKDVALLGGWAPLLSLLVGPIAVLIAMGHWRYCLRNYQGAGG